jgi:hypothetical protein
LKVHRYFFNRGSKSRNKVAVGEPAAGSFSDDQKNKKTKPRIRAHPRGAIKTPSKLYCFCRLISCFQHQIEARLSQRVAMDDLASYFVEERSKVR